MPKKVLSIGQCGPDHSTLCRFLESNFAATVVPGSRFEDSIEKLRTEPFDLVLVNRKLDADYSDGLEILKRIKADPELAHLPVMLITNYSEHQEQAVAAGAVPGFGKLEYHKPETLEKLRPFVADGQ